MAVGADLAKDEAITKGSTPHAVPLPMGEGTVLQPLYRRPLSHGERDSVRGDSLICHSVLCSSISPRHGA